MPQLIPFFFNIQTICVSISIPFIIYLISKYLLSKYSNFDSDRQSFL